MKPREYRKNDKSRPRGNKSPDKLSITNQALLNRKILSPQKLKILVLSGNELTNQELDFIHKCISLLKLDLSNNKITRISKNLGLRNLNELRVVHMHNNRIDKIDGLEGIIDLCSLVYFTLHENPVMNLPKLEHLVVNMIPALRVFNYRVIMVEERSPQILLERPQKYVDASFLEEWRSNSTSQVYYIKVLQMQLNYVENVWLRNNPIVLIQRVWKAIAHQRTKNQRPQRKGTALQISKQLPTLGISNLQRAFNTWKQFSKSRRAIRLALKDESNEANDKSYLTYRLGNYRMAKRNLRLQQYVEVLMKRIRHKIMLKNMCKVLVFNLKIRVYNFNHSQAFYNVCEINKNNRIYFGKSQRHLLDNFLAHIANNFNFREYIYSHTNTGNVKQYLSIRMVDPESVENKKCYNVLTYLIWPSMRVIFLKKRKYQRKYNGIMLNIRPLYYIKSQNKMLSQEQYNKSVQLFQRIERFSKNQYEESLMYFECKDEEIMKYLIRYIFYHNTKKMELKNILNKNKTLSLLQNFQEPFVFYNEKVVERSAAAVKIQQSWRRYLCVKSGKVSIYQQIKKNRAILRLQQFFRSQRFYHRFSFMKYFYKKLEGFCQPSFLIHQAIYTNLPQLTQQSRHCSLYPDAKLIRTQTHISLTWQFEKFIFPQSFIQHHFSKRSHQHQQLQSQAYKELTMSTPGVQQADIYQLLHIGATVHRLQYNGHSFIRFSYRNMQQAKFRIGLLAVMSYRMYGGKYILPVAKNAFEDFGKLIEGYRKFSCLKDAIPSSKHSYPNESKLTSIKEINSDQGMFLFTEKAKQFKPDCKTFFVEFYQKKYNDFPIKYIGDIYYCTNGMVSMQHSLLKGQNVKNQIEQMQKINSRELLRKEMKIIEENQLQQNKQKSIDGDHSFRRTYKLSQPNRQKDSKNQTMRDDSFLNISKIDKKRLSLYDIGYSTEVRLAEDPLRKQHAQTSFHESRKEVIENTYKQELYRKQLQKHKKKTELTNLREKVRKERSINDNIKNMKEMERTDEIRRRVDRIRQFKSRASSNKKQVQSDFIQQGNFVMEQQLKMVIMRNKFKDRQAKSKEKQSTIQASKQSALNKMGRTMSIISKNESELKDNCRMEVLEEVQGDQREIRNTRVSFGVTKRSRNSSVGAYIRDPAFVHGVFPEEYYPIENKRNMKIIFPPL